MSDEITVKELKALADLKQPYTLIDVREPHEYEFANLGGKLIPLGQVLDRKAEIPVDGLVVVQCRSGKRSRDAIEALKPLGYKNLVNLEGGILAWSREIDPSVPQY